MIFCHSKSFSDLSKGNLVNWDESSWELDEKMEWVNMTQVDVCTPTLPKDIIFPEYWTFDEMLLMCNKLGGNLSVTGDKAKQDALIAEFKRKLPNDFDGYQSCRFLEVYNI